MALYEFKCRPCNLKFEQITRLNAPDLGECPKCHKQESDKLISNFAINGQGDQRESTMHGCHDGFSGVESAPQSTATEITSHSCGSGCSH